MQLHLLQKVGLNAGRFAPGARRRRMQKRPPRRGAAAFLPADRLCGPAKRPLLLLLTLLFLLPSAACGKTDGRFSDTWFDLFDTVVTVTAYDDSAAAFEEHSAALREKLTYYHRLFDRYHAYEGVINVRTLNDEAKNGPVRVDDALFSLLEFGKETYQTTGGRVNVCMGAVLSLWHDYREAGADDPENAALPPENTLRDAAEHISIEDLVLDAAEKTVFFADPLLELDVGALAKGYAAQAAAAWAKETLWDAAVLSLGGNVAAFGTNRTNSRGLWNVGVENPDETAEDFLATVSVTDRAVVTSGDYQRYYTVDGERYCHIIDPDTLFPARYFTSVTVICGDSALADALSTALFLLPESEGMALIEATADAEARWAKPDGETLQSSGFAAYLKK